MATDLTSKEASGATRIVGSEENNKETNAVDVTDNNELRAIDVPELGVSTSLTLTATAQELKVGATALPFRKYIEMQATSQGVKWGYNTNCDFNLFKNQFFSLPAGANCKVYLKASSGTATIVIAEKGE